MKDKRYIFILVQVFFLVFQILYYLDGYHIQSSIMMLGAMLTLLCGIIYKTLLEL